MSHETTNQQDVSQEMENEYKSSLNHGQQLDRVASGIGRALVAVATIVVVISFVTLLIAAPPPIGWTTQATVVSVHDGDTFRVRITREFNVRVRNCWAKELSEKGGPEARDYMKQLVDGKAVTLHVPGNIDLGKMTTMSRIIADVYRDNESVAEKMVAAGYATKEKQKEQR